MTCVNMFFRSDKVQPTSGLSADKGRVVKMWAHPSPWVSPKAIERFDPYRGRRFA